MREIEVKARVHNKDQLLAALAKLNIQLATAKKQHDIVYSQPGAKDNQPGANWLRVRIENDSKVIFTLKRSVTNELDSIEHEVIVDNSDELRTIIEYMNYELFSDLTKTRQKARYGDIEICLDEIPKLGLFIEAEKLCQEDVDYDLVANELWQLLEELGIQRTDQETHGYDVMMRELDQAEEK